MLVILLGGVGYLTASAVNEDYQARWTDAGQYAEIEPLVERLGSDKEKIAAHFDNDPQKIAEYKDQLAAYERYRKSLDYLTSVEDAQAEAERVIDLAGSPDHIPTTGALTLLRNDPKTQGPKLFAAHCASCHSYVAPDVDKAKAQATFADATAPNLFGFADRTWLTGLLNPEQIDSPEYFGNTAHNEGEMAGFVKDTMSEWEAGDVNKVVLALSAEAQLPRQAAADEKDADAIAAGRELISSEDNCAMCHKFFDAGELGTAPDLTGYGSRKWLIGMISNPATSATTATRTIACPPLPSTRATPPTTCSASRRSGCLPTGSAAPGTSRRPLTRKSSPSLRTSNAVSAATRVRRVR